MKARWACLIVGLVVAACARPTAVAPETVIMQATQAPLATYTPLPTYTPPEPLPTYTSFPTYTPAATATAIPEQTATSVPTKTPEPTKVSTPTAAATEGIWIGKNHVATIEQGKLTVKLARILFEDKATVAKREGKSIDGLGADWESATILGEMIFVITNASGKTLSVYPDQGIVLIGSRQIELALMTSGLAALDDISGDIYDGVTKVGGFWYPLARLTMDDIKTVTLRVSAPVDEEFNWVGEEFVFMVDLSSKPQEPLDPSVLQP
jgi:hypothetical protein